MAEKKAARSREEPAPPARRAPVDQLTITDGALAMMIGLAVHEVPGVVGMVPAGVREGSRRLLGRQQVDEGVVVSRPEDDYEIDLHVVVAYGVNILAVADSVLERVAYTARALAGVEVCKVRVHVAGVSRG